MTTREGLIASRKLIAVPWHWCKWHHVRRGLFGLRYCAAGAVEEATRGTGLYGACMGALIDAGARDGVRCFNDSHGHRSTVELFDRAIEAAS